jgi:hypothetical protein
MINVEKTKYMYHYQSLWSSKKWEKKDNSITPVTTKSGLWKRLFLSKAGHGLIFEFQGLTGMLMVANKN